MVAKMCSSAGPEHCLPWWDATPRTAVSLWSLVENRRHLSISTNVSWTWIFHANRESRWWLVLVRPSKALVGRALCRLGKHRVKAFHKASGLLVVGDW